MFSFFAKTAIRLSAATGLWSVVVPLDNHSSVSFRAKAYEALIFHGFDLFFPVLHLPLPEPEPVHAMSILQTQFEAAVAESKTLNERPDNNTLLKIYALYKQASAGDNAETKPGFADMVGRAKWDAWTKLKGCAADDARQQYIDLIDSLS